MSGHGWVTPNPNGLRARCGGPGLCVECSREAAQKATSAASDRPKEAGPSQGLSYPDEITPELAEVLGKPNFWCSPIAHAFRDAGHEIPRKAEAEQAFVLHWLVKLVLRHGAEWQQYARRELNELRQKSAQPEEIPHHG